MNSADYWQRRAEENALRVYQYSERKAQLITRWFGRAEREMRQKVAAFHQSYAKKEGITLAAAKATITNRHALSLTLEQCRTLAQKAPHDEEIKKLLDKAYLSRAISREEFLIMQLNLLSSAFYSEYASEVATSLNTIFEESYYKSIFDYQQFIGFGSSFNRISINQIEAACETAWQGKNYSERIWGGHRVTLARYLNRIITNGFVQGNSGEHMTLELQKAMSMSAFNARRLIRTECAQVTGRANLLAYEQNGTPRFEFLAVLDYKTSVLCRSMDGKVFAISEGKIGVNMPPLHPFCRSTTVPYIPDAELDYDDTRTARNGRGETYKVPANMNYRDWHTKYVASAPDELLAEQKYKHGTTDAAKYKEYVATLGKDAPKTFDEYQNIKYTGGEQIHYISLDYKRRRRLQMHRELALPNSKFATAASEKFTKYLFDGENPDGLAKGKAISSRLGYDKFNWKLFQQELLHKASLYPVSAGLADDFGERYEQKVIINGLKSTPANVISAWIVKDGKTWLTSAYIKEAD